ncbi:thiamine phosphate synthase [Nitrosophilus alvini]|uniref:thiamine phosphate synthase n=1 Tax=Nitrosophilus alvini TaxID=2714855 RepID=UPI00190D5E9A|nr:thiamine phosphate synthase [Nitrosophilus alvini]
MKSYLISDPEYYGKTPKSVKEKAYKIFLQKEPDFVCFRDKKTSKFQALASAFTDTARKAGIEKIIIHSDIETALALEAYGVHLSTSDFFKIPIAKSKGLYVIASTHSLEEAQEAYKMGADAVTFSPVFYTPLKGRPQGLEKLKEIVDKIPIDVIALGGIITDKEVKKVAKTGCFGFASIRYFVS